MNIKEYFTRKKQIAFIFKTNERAARGFLDFIALREDFVAYEKHMRIEDKYTAYLFLYPGNTKNMLCGREVYAAHFDLEIDKELCDWVNTRIRWCC